MKKLLLFLTVFVFFAGQMYANPVDVNTAKALGVKYLKTNVLSAKNITDAELVYTSSSEDGTSFVYVFNYENGFVMVAADDSAYPILAYSEEGVFDANNIPEGLQYYLGHYAKQIQYAIDNELVADDEIAAQWDLLRKEGITMRDRMNNVVEPLLTTTWNQDSPYNYYAPAASGGSGGHCYVGCVATAMSQVLKYWNWPVTGNGEHSYSTSTYGGTLSVNFGATTYDWANMPNSVYSVTPQAQAIALMMYHCAVSVDMDFTPSGSGAYTEDVVNAAINYFRYGACTNMKYRESFSKTVWEDMLIASFDRGFPVVYSGVDGNEGHAFNCDGYDANRKFHFNWGWSGGANGYYEIDALNIPWSYGGNHFNEYQRVVFDMIPDYVYDVMVPAISTLEAEVADAITKTVTLSWTVPSVAASGAALTSIDEITLKRNGETIRTYSNPQPGEVVVYEDELDEYGCYEYTITAKNNGYESEKFSQTAMTGPNCTWKLVCTTSNFQGWNEGKVQFVSSNGTIFDEVTMTSASPLSQKVQVPEGDFSMKWYAPTSEISTMSLNLKNSAGQSVYSFSGSSSQLSGTIYSGNNDCVGCTAPTNFAGVYQNQQGVNGSLLSWTCDYEPSNFKIYRSTDGEEYVEIAKIANDLREYFDGVNAAGTYYYKVTAYSSACESTPALTPDDSDYVVVELNAMPENSINARIYPNPTAGNLRIEADAIENISIFNLVGQKIYEENITSDQSVIDMQKFGCGIYMVRIVTTNGFTTQKVSVIE